MKRPIALVVTVAFVMQLTGCAVSVTVRVHQRILPSQLQGPPLDDIITGVTTNTGEEVHFDTKTKVASQAASKSYNYKTYTQVRGDTLYGHVDGKPYRIALTEVQELWVKRIDEEKTRRTTKTMSYAIFIALLVIALYT